MLKNIIMTGVVALSVALATQLVPSPELITEEFVVTSYNNVTGTYQATNIHDGTDKAKLFFTAEEVEGETTINEGDHVVSYYEEQGREDLFVKARKVQTDNACTPADYAHVPYPDEYIFDCTSDEMRVFDRATGELIATEGICKGDELKAEDGSCVPPEFYAGVDEQ